MPVFLDIPTLGWRFTDQARVHPLASAGGAATAGDIGKDILFDVSTSTLWVLTDNNILFASNFNTSTLTLGAVTPAQGGESFIVQNGDIWVNKGSVVVQINGTTHAVTASHALGFTSDGGIVAGVNRAWVCRKLADAAPTFGGVDVEFSTVLTSSTLTGLTASTYSTVLTVSGADFGTGCSYAASHIVGTDIATMGSVVSKLEAHWNSQGARIKMELSGSDIQIRNASPLERPFFLVASVTDNAAGSALFGDMTNFKALTQVAGTSFVLNNDELYGIDVLGIPGSITAAIDIGGNFLTNGPFSQKCPVLFNDDALYVLRAQDRDISASQLAGAQLLRFDEVGGLTTTINFPHTGNNRVMGVYGMFDTDPVTAGQFYILTLEGLPNKKPINQFQLFASSGNSFTPASVRTAFRGLGTTFDIVTGALSRAEQTKVEVPSGAGFVTAATPASHWRLFAPGTEYYVWYSAGVATDPAASGTGIQVDSSTIDNSATVATDTAAAITALGDFTATANDAAVTITNAAVGGVADASDITAGISVSIIDHGVANFWFWSLGTGGLVDPFEGMNLIGSRRTGAGNTNFFNAILAENPQASTWGSSLFSVSTLSGYNVSDIELCKELSHSEGPLGVSTGFVLDISASAGTLSYEKMVFAVSTLFLLKRDFITPTGCSVGAELVAIKNPNDVQGTRGFENSSPTRKNFVSVDAYTDITLS